MSNDPISQLKSQVEFLYSYEQISRLGREMIITGVTSLANFSQMDVRLSEIYAWAYLGLTLEEQAIVDEKVSMPADVRKVVDNPPETWPEPKVFNSVFDITEEDIEKARQRYASAVTAAADRYASKVAVMNPRKVATYTLKRDEYQRYFDETEAQLTPNPSEYPALMADVGAGLYADLDTSAQANAAAGEAWTVINAGIEQIEQTTWLAISAASTIPEIQTAYNSAVTQFSVFIDQVLQQ